MSEEDPFRRGRGELEPTSAELDGPNVISTFDAPVRPDAVKAHEAAIRKHLQDRRPDGAPPAAPGT
jgi:hypothetical protein